MIAATYPDGSLVPTDAANGTFVTTVPTRSSSCGIYIAGTFSGSFCKINGNSVSIGVGGIAIQAPSFVAVAGAGAVLQVSNNTLTAVASLVTAAASASTPALLSVGHCHLGGGNNVNITDNVIEGLGGSH